MRRARRSTRGQALVELALGSLIFITILIAGIHFGEISHLAMKTHEAAASAAWDSTSYRVERLGPAGIDVGAMYDVAPIAVPFTNSKGSARYVDWDGRTAVNRGAGPRQLFTDAQPMQTICSKTSGTDLEFRTQDTALTPAFQDPGVMSCVSAGSINAINIPSFHQESSGGYFKAAHLRTAPLKVCGFGRASGGDCSGRMELLLGDHGLTSINGEDAQCAALNDDDGVMNGAACANRPFYRLTQENWYRSMGWTGAPEEFAERVTGRKPRGRVTGFYMSFRGEESDFKQQDSFTGRRWDATPMDYNPSNPMGSYRTAYTQNVQLAQGDGMDFLFLGRYRCD